MTTTEEETARGPYAYVETRLRCGTLTPGITQILGMLRYAADGCLSFGTYACAECEFAAFIPRDDCRPPDECAACEARQRCPCGNRQHAAAIRSYTLFA